MTSSSVEASATGKDTNGSYVKPEWPRFPAKAYNQPPPCSAGKGGTKMRKLVTASLAVLAFALSGSMVNCAMAQDKKAGKGAPKTTMKVVAEKGKAPGVEGNYAPGREN